MDLTKLEKCRQWLRSRMPLIGGWLQGQALKSLADDGSAEAVRILEEAVVYPRDEALSASAVESLGQLAQQENVAAQEALCRLVIGIKKPRGHGLL